MKQEIAVEPSPDWTRNLADKEILVRIKCKGISPLLLNAKSREVTLSLRAKDKKPKNAPKPSPHDEAASKLYMLPDGRLHLPLQNVYSCLVKAGQGVRLDGKRQVSTAKSTLLPSLMSIEDSEIVLESPGWEADVQGGVNPNGGEAVCIIRPRFDEWGFVFHARIDTSEIAEQVIRELVDKAGSRVGLGDFRPERKGFYGRFRVVGWDRLNGEQKDT